MATTVFNREGAGDRYLVHAYVGDGEVHRTDEMGTVTFTWLFQHRPKDCHFVVASQWDVRRHDRKYIVWDLYKTRMNRWTKHIQTPKPRLIHTDLDAAIMAAVMLGNDGAS